MTGNPVGGVIAVASNLFLSHTKVGQKFTMSVAENLFNDVLGLPTKFAYMASSIALNAALTFGLTKSYQLMKGVPAANPGNQIPNGHLENAGKQSPYYDYIMNQGKGGMLNGGGNILDTIRGGGSAFELLDPQGNLIGIYAHSPAFNSGTIGSLIGLKHTAAVIKSVGGQFFNSMSGFTGANIYLGAVVCHQMTNQAIAKAGYALTVSSIKGSGILTYISGAAYGPYGSASPGVSYYKAEKKY